LKGGKTHYEIYVYSIKQEVMEQRLSERLPTLSEMIHYYGPYLGLVLSLVIVILILQHFWFNKVLKSKNEEIKRLADREQKLNDRYLYMIDQEIAVKRSEKN
jgi:hypothetical protein